MSLATVELECAEGFTSRNITTWEELSLPPRLLANLYAKGFARPTAIQCCSVDAGLRSDSTGRPYDIIAQAKNGSGKTAAFSIIAISRVNPEQLVPQVIIMNNTRELAKQNADVIRDLAKGTSVTVSELLYTGATEAGDRRAEHAVDGHIVVGTPGILLKVIRRMNTNSWKLLVLDEADALTSDISGSGNEVEELMKLVGNSAQKICFSATFPKRSYKMLIKMCHKPIRFRMADNDLGKLDITHFVISVVTEEEKQQKLLAMLNTLTISQAVVFADARSRVGALQTALKQDGFETVALTGGKMTPEERDKTMMDFRAGKAKVLIATDVLSRGIDIPQVRLVVNYSLPMIYENNQNTGHLNSETFLHRVGRTGRFTRRGVSLTFCSPEQRTLIDKAMVQFNLKFYDIPDIDAVEQQLKQLEASLEKE